MTVSAPIIGLIATLGGAIVGAIAAIYGPSLLHKRQAEEKTQENKALKNDAAIIRLVALRVAGKAWLNALRRVADDLSAGRIMNLDAFDAEMNPLGEELDRSTYGLMVDNTWVSSAEPVFFPNRKPQLLGDETTGTAYTAVLTYLHAANTSLRRDLRDGQVFFSRIGIDIGLGTNVITVGVSKAHQSTEIIILRHRLDGIEIRLLRGIGRLNK